MSKLKPQVLVAIWVGFPPFDRASSFPAHNDIDSEKSRNITLSRFVIVTRSNLLPGLFLQQTLNVLFELSAILNVPSILTALRNHKHLPSINFSYYSHIQGSLLCRYPEFPR
jgi:hypothetical protein